MCRSIPEELKHRGLERTDENIAKIIFEFQFGFNPDKINKNTNDDEKE